MPGIIFHTYRVSVDAITQRLAGLWRNCNVVLDVRQVPNSVTASKAGCLEGTQKTNPRYLKNPGYPA